MGSSPFPSECKTKAVMVASQPGGFCVDVVPLVVARDGGEGITEEEWVGGIVRGGKGGVGSPKIDDDGAGLR